MATILDNLNEEQRKPAEVISGPVLVTAGAGSGKTRLLTHRIAYMVNELNISPKNILAITFTNKAANEMKDRITKLVNVSVDDMWISTFHSMCGRILRMFAERVGLGKNFSIYGDTEKDRLIKRLLKENPKFLNLEKNSLKPETVAFHISNAKNELYSPEEYAVKIKNERNADIIINVYRNYQKELLQANAVDFDDMLVKAYELLEQNEDVCEYFQTKFRYIHVDEFQDTNVVQYKLVSLLGQKYHNIFVVGDEDQCIYSWRGAKFTNVAKFINNNKDISIFKLEQNYRSTTSILNTANKIIANNINRIEKNLWTDNKEGSVVKLFTAYSDLEEAEFVASKIKQMVNNGARYSDFAVLMRINSLSRVVEEKCLNYNIPYKVYGGFKFFERKEVKDALSYLKIISNPKDTDSFIRVLAFPKKGIGETTINKLLQVKEQLNLSLFEIADSGAGLDDGTIKKLTPIINQLKRYIEQKNSVPLSKLFSDIIDEFGLTSCFSKQIEEEYSKILNIQTLQKSIIEFEEVNEGSSLDDYLQSITLSRDIDSMDENEDCVSLMTIHSAKGLEFKYVFIIGLVEGVLPLSRAVYSLDPNDLEEERRLMYVASTRAMEELYFTRPTSKFNFETKRTESTMPSRFLKEAGVVGITNSSENHNDNRGNSYGVNMNKTYRSSADFVSLDEENEEPTKPVSADKINSYAKYKVGTKVMHKNFGIGTVIVGVTDYVGAFVTIRFDSVGVKTLSLKFAPLEILEGN
ncbi:MAG: ATP-dependent helicase [Christensenellales bacterium]